jgi:3-(3-hydroxy-phenyl)propionate hydroxylase
MNDVDVDVDVLVVGGGPTGITTAALLAQRGMTVRVLERATGIYDLPRAIVMDDEIQRIIQGLGASEGLAAITTPLAGAEFVDTDGKRIMGIEIDPDRDFPNGHSPNVTYYQPQLEEFLRSVADRMGADLVLGVTVESVEQDDSGVTVHTDAGDHRGRWLVAADGASSPIRKQLGVPFVDQGFDQDWLVLDAELKRPVPTLPRFVQQVCDPDRPVTFVVGHADYRRWEFQLQPGEDRDVMLRPERLWDLLDGWMTPDDADIIRALVYRFHATVAERMRVGRVFLAGDAAHQMPPFLGQGLCSGLRDGANLAWKLDLVERGLAGDALLDTYGDERLPHAAGVVEHAVDTGRLIDQLAGRESHGVALDSAYGGGRPFPYLEHGLLHGEHPMVGRQMPQPPIDGTLLDEIVGPKFGVVTDDDAVAAVARAAWGEIATVVEVPAGSVGSVLPPGGAVIVRPDRYVAAVAADVDELAAATESLLAQLHPTGVTTRRCLDRP